MQVNGKMKNRYQLPEKRCWVWLSAMLGIIGVSLFTASLIQTSDYNTFLCSLTKTRPEQLNKNEPTWIQFHAILHYATSHVVPQQSLSEITVTFDVLKSLSRPSNFLVFGLGHDSLMWASINPRGTTLFLEEDPKWVQTVLKDAPELRAHAVRYRTQLRDADRLLSGYRSEQACSPETATLRGNERCQLALHNLPEEVYEREWDLIMIDAPRGYFAEAPGRMAAIFSAAVMARNRKGSGVTHVFLHDVDRKVEKVYAEEFLCRKNLVKGVGRLWHFQIPPKGNHTHNDARFC
ncbi:probable methyltransferase At1g27930 [Abrus precatorius]|uniref:Probable methyltransferase At1g27930 n=1 Tax=Abrus precatorius TaxID=3816 RepID=A0A8B8KFP0_ABRPR|nr:probable methyltransferase At1g27930 [Abrus precatorius]